MSARSITPTQTELAGLILQARGRTARFRLIRNVSGESLAVLGRSLKDICYAKWSSEPAIARKAATAMAEIANLGGSKELDAAAAWIRGIAEITRGRLESAIDSLQQSSDTYRQLKDKKASADPMVAMLIPLGMLGRYEEAAAVGRKALRIFVEVDDQLAAAKIELNLSNIAARRERHRDAERLALSALKRFATLGEREWQAMTENDLASTYAELSEIALADKFYRSALKHAAAAGMEVTEAEIEANIGNLARARGNYRDALHLLERSRARYEKLGLPHQSALAELEIADMNAELNLFSEAAAAYEKLVKRLHTLGLRSDEARARSNYGRVLSANGETAKARRQFRTALRLYKREENNAGVALIHILSASLEMSSQNAAAADDHISEAVSILSKTPSPRRMLNAEWLRAESARLKGAKQAARMLTIVLNEARRLNDPLIQIAALTAQGKISAAKRDLRPASEHFRAAIRMIESVRAPLPGEEFRRAYIGDKVMPYQELARLYLSTERYSDALETVERGRARSLAEMVSAASEKYSSAVMDPEVLDLRAKLNWNYLRSGSISEVAEKRFRSRTATLERELASRIRRAKSTGIRADLDATAGAYENFSIRALKELLNRANKSLVEYIALDGHYAAFVVTGSNIKFFPKLASIETIDRLIREFDFQCSAIRLASGSGQFAEILRRKADKALNRMYLELIEPLLEATAARDLVISPSGQLNLVPFAALFDGERYLIENRSIVHTPSAAVWATLAKRKTRHLDPVQLFGYADENIPLVNAEIDALSALFPGSEVFKAEDARFQTFIDRAGAAGLLHVACHGSFRPDNPMFSSLHFSDGRITANDIINMRLRAELVVLSACETAINKVYPGDELVGLGRGFLASGVSNVLMTLWTVNDAAAREIMVEMYGGLQRGRTIAASITEAQRKMIAKEKHPYFWAPFVLVGR